MKPPSPLNLLLRTLPDKVHAELLSRLFNHLLKGQYLAEQLSDLEGKVLSIAITDTGNQISFQIRNGKFTRTTDNHWDVRIKGSVAEFWLLATRAEDPDTLFFHRRLAIEGETETGLHLKNLLDSMEFDWRAHVDAVAGPRLATLIKRAVEKSGLERRMQLTLQP